MKRARRVSLIGASFWTAAAIGCNGSDSAITGCGKDTDCKDDRICVDYMCVDPDGGLDETTDALTSDSHTSWSTTSESGDPSTSGTDPTTSTGPEPDMAMAPDCEYEGESIATGESFLYSHAELGSNGIVYFLDNDYREVRRYDMVEDAFLSSWDVDLGASAMAVSPDGVDVYVGYENGRIDHITEDGTKTFLVALAEEVLTLGVVDDWLFAIDPSGAWESHWLLDRDTGVVTATEEWRSNSRGIAYSAELQRVFTLRDGTSPNDIIMTDIDTIDGALGNDVDSPYHGDYQVGHPLRIFPDGVRISVSSGAIFSTSDLTYIGSLGLDYVDLGFYGDQLFALTEIGGQGQLQQLEPNFAIAATDVFYAEPERLFIHDSTLAVFVRCDLEIGIIRRAL